MEPYNGKYAVQYDEVHHIYRNVAATGGLLERPRTPHYKNLKGTTLAHLFDFMANEFGDNDFMGWRDLVKTHHVERQSTDGNRKTWAYYELSDYQWMSYRAAKEKANQIGLGIKDLGIQKGDFVLVFASTCPEWYLISHGCFTQSIAIVTAYDSMDENTIRYIIDQADPKAIFADPNTLPVVASLMRRSSHGIKAVIYSGKESEVSEHVGRLEGIEGRSFKVTHIDEYKAKSTEANEDGAEVAYPQSEDVACIMYTSGSTGEPKGVQLTHGNLMAAIGSAAAMFGDQWNKHEDVVISYLPLAHVLEFVLSHYLASVGCRLGFARARTLMDDAVVAMVDGAPTKGVGDLKALRPTLMAGVPTIWERIRKGILNEVNKQSYAVRQIFFAAFNAKWAMIQATGSQNVVTNAIDAAALKQAKDIVGGRLRMALTGGAGISDETHRFLSTVMCYVVSGYGLTEISGIGSVTFPRLGYRLRTVGPPAPSLELKLVNVPDTDYTGDNGTGEIWLRGPSVMKGYFKMESETKKVMTSDGWFKTGDIGTMNDDGTLSITDRVKNLVKLAHGEYVALEKCEAIYRDSSAIKNICIIADNGCPVLVAVVEPMESGASEKDMLDALKEQAHSSGLSRSETVQGVIVEDADWTKNGFLTSSGKVKRREVKKKHEKAIDELMKKL